MMACQKNRLVVAAAGIMLIFALAGCNREGAGGNAATSGSAPGEYQGGNQANYSKEYCFVLSNSPAAITTFTVDYPTGALTEVASTPLAWTKPGWQQPKTLALNPAGASLYVTSFGGSSPDKIFGYFINSNNGSLTPAAGFPQTVDVKVEASIVDPRGRFLYLASQDPQNPPYSIISAFRIAPRSGALTPVVGSPFKAGFSLGPMSIDPSGSFLYMGAEAIVEGQGAVPSLLAYRITSDGALAPLAGSPFMISGPSSTVGNAASSLVSPSDLEQDPWGRFLYVLQGDQIWVFKRDRGGGAVKVTGDSPFITGFGATGALALEPTGRFIYVAVQNLTSVGTVSRQGGVRGFSIDDGTGSLRGIGNAPYPANNPYSVLTDPSGRYLYSANSPDRSLEAYKIQSDGTLSVVPGLFRLFPATSFSSLIDIEFMGVK